MVVACSLGASLSSELVAFEEVEGEVGSREEGGVE